MVTRVGRPLFVTSALLLVAGSAAAQGYTVRSWGYHDLAPYGPVIGETYSFSPYRPTVTMYDSWGRLVDMPLRPKVLYYDTPFWTPQGWYRPTSITVMPQPWPGYSTAQRVESARPAASAPRPEPIPPAATYPYDGGPTNPVPAVTPGPPVPRPAIAEQPAAAPAVPELPRVPKVPALPDVPRSPAVEKATVPVPADVPKLGPSPMDIPPTTRPGG